MSNNTERKWALKTLQWVFRAKRPLTPEELLEAIALEDLDTKFRPERMASSLEYLIQVCGNLVVIYVPTKCLRFVHYSVQGYLDRKQKFESSEDHVAVL